VLPVTESREALAIAKIAMVPGADHQVTAEAGWLTELEGVPELEGQMPRLMAEGVAPTSRRYLVATAAPNTRSTGQFTRAHAAVLGLLAGVRQEVMSLTASRCFEYLEQTLVRLKPHLTRNERTILQAVLGDCRSLLAGWTGPFVTAHGDFAPWNIRLHRDRL